MVSNASKLNFTAKMSLLETQKIVFGPLGTSFLSHLSAKLALCGPKSAKLALCGPGSSGLKNYLLGF